MAASTQPEDEDAKDEQAIDHTEAEDAEEIRKGLPADVEERLTKRAFSPGALRKLLRDTYYIGPIGIGSGGWRGVYGGGKPGTQMRRPDGALYNFPRSWRYAALERALKTGLITHVGGGLFCATERGVAVLRRIDRCHECGEERVPMVRHSHYVGNPNTEGHLESHALVTACETHESTGYAGGSTSVGYEDFDRDEDAVERAMERIEGHPEARTFGGSREVRPEAAEEIPELDEDELDEVLEEYVEAYTPASPREIYEAGETDLYDRLVVNVPAEGAHFKAYGNDDALVVSRTDEEGEVHFTVEDAEEGRVRAHMSYEVAVEQGAKDALKHPATNASWEGDYWTYDADGLAAAFSVLTGDYKPQHKDKVRVTVTATEEAVALADVPMPGIDAEGELTDLPAEE